MKLTVEVMPKCPGFHFQKCKEMSAINSEFDTVMGIIDGGEDMRLMIT